MNQSEQNQHWLFFDWWDDERFWRMLLTCHYIPWERPLEAWL